MPDHATQNNYHDPGSSTAELDGRFSLAPGDLVVFREKGFNSPVWRVEGVYYGGTHVTLVRIDGGDEIYWVPGDQLMDVCSQMLGE